MRAATAPAKEMIDVDALRIGMFLHLDVGWMSHPFPLSSFRIASADQIDILRSLGLKQVRWSPEHSALHDAQARGHAESAGRVAPAAAAPAPAVMAAPESPEATARR